MQADRGEGVLTCEVYTNLVALTTLRPLVSSAASLALRLITVSTAAGVSAPTAISNASGTAGMRSGCEQLDGGISGNCIEIQIVTDGRLPDGNNNSTA